MSKRNLLVCFDAFGTLFRPRWPIEQQYADAARACGLWLDGFNEADVKASFRRAFTQQSATHPNYGKATGMGDKNWWTEVIRNTFQPLVPLGRELPEKLAPMLRRRFATREGYSPVFRLPILLQKLKQCPKSRYDSVVVGVITNSDPRVQSILSSMRLNVSPLRYGVPVADLADWPPDPAQPGAHDIDFCAMSYDVGYEKPDKGIFVAAEKLLDTLLMHTGRPPMSIEPDRWTKLYVGDEYAKDVLGAVGAGWDGMLVGHDPRCQEKLDRVDFATRKDPHDVLVGRSVLRADSIEDLVGWVTGMRLMLGTERNPATSPLEDDYPIIARRS